MLKSKLLFLFVQALIVVALVYISTFKISLEVLHSPYYLSQNQKYYYLFVHPLLAAVLSGLVSFLTFRRRVSTRFIWMVFVVCLAILIIYYYDLLFISRYA